ncbi:LAMI_0D05380g1_1 [Lachancea mirantina]|uniref:LAMI_0D05380g1_1 n=1 Tax=Lachancea mirantina TaxID=1230905 RepID=A0A1G4JBQ7_9SACH|nr:LAMI_0D05380g1_1 [Lachancea mirantina]
MRIVGGARRRQLRSAFPATPPTRPPRGARGSQRARGPPYAVMAACCTKPARPFPFGRRVIRGSAEARTRGCARNGLPMRPVQTHLPRTLAADACMHRKPSARCHWFARQPFPLTAHSRADTFSARAARLPAFAAVPALRQGARGLGVQRPGVHGRACAATSEPAHKYALPAYGEARVGSGQQQQRPAAARPCTQEQAPLVRCRPGQRRR